MSEWLLAWGRLTDPKKGAQVAAFSPSQTGLSPPPFLRSRSPFLSESAGVSVDTHHSAYPPTAAPPTHQAGEEDGKRSPRRVGGFPRLEWLPSQVAGGSVPEGRRPVGHRDGFVLFGKPFGWLRDRLGVLALRLAPGGHRRAASSDLRCLGIVKSTEAGRKI